MLSRSSPPSCVHEEANTWGSIPSQGGFLERFLNDAAIPISVYIR
jgi:hypothetical protein